MKQEPPPTGTEGTSGRIFIVAGELSGDQHAAGMLGALLSGPEETRPSQVAGLGGSRMQALCPEVEDWLEQAAVLGLVEVLKKYGWFRDKMAETVTRILEGSFDGVVLVDYPGFNLRLAQRLRDKGYRGKLIYYISPQVWAWKRGRVKTMARLLDGMICIFPFEKEFYDDSGLPTQFSGHPLVDALAPKRLPQGAREAGLVALLPGSREREIAALFPAMLDAASRLLKVDPTLRFAIAPANERLAAQMQAMAQEAGLGEVARRHQAGVHDLMQRAIAGAVASGTATLEAAFFGLPYCLVYRVAWLTYVVGRLVVHVKFLGIVNLLAGREVVRELLQKQCDGAHLAAELSRLLGDPVARNRLRQEFAEVVASLGSGSAYQNAAAAVRQFLLPCDPSPSPDSPSPPSP
ncbi:MAG: lipid-A-disaccharide synthase [Verrucomicrobiales bacterium]